MQPNRYKATLTLSLSAFLFLVSLPLTSTLAGGFVFSACSAALVGGMADWFAVSALFRRPLGISFRTAIIPRNRERIFNDIVDMIENRLFTKKHVKEQIVRYNMANVVIEYLEQAGGRSNLHNIIRKLTGDLLGRVKPNEIALIIDALIRGYAQSVNTAPLVVHVLRWSMEREYDQKILRFLLDELIQLCKKPYFIEILQQVLEKTKETYAAGRNRRKLVLWCLDFGGMSTQTMANVALRELIGYLETLKLPGSTLAVDSQLWLEKLMGQLETDLHRIEQIEKLKQVLLEQLPIRRFVSAGIRQGLDALQERDGELFHWQQWLDRHLDQTLDEFVCNSSQQQKLDRSIKLALLMVINRYHQQVGRLVRENLAVYTNEHLVTFIESRVGDDLQMIRINGALVGGLVGVLLHLVNLVIVR